jgi:hypothetical protein
MRGKNKKIMMAVGEIAMLLGYKTIVAKAQIILT